MWGKGRSHEVLVSEGKIAYRLCFGYAVLVGGEEECATPVAAYRRLPGPEDAVLEPWFEANCAGVVLPGVWQRLFVAADAGDGLVEVNLIFRKEVL